jgi:pimeloyl-ACP methyl ester carboxylesterase
VFVGASLGGITSIGTAAVDPTRVAGIVLIDVAHRVDAAGRERLVEFFVITESS